VRVHYNLGLAHQQLGEVASAQAAFEAARRISPDDVEVLRALAILRAQQADWTGAAVYVDALLRVAPDDPTARALRLRIEQERARGGGG
jgi:cytochrome c-type biogenesis protein CcmH/NrfG